MKRKEHIATLLGRLRPPFVRLHVEGLIAVVEENVSWAPDAILDARKIFPVKLDGPHVVRRLVQHPLRATHHRAASNGRR